MTQPLEAMRHVIVLLLPRTVEIDIEDHFLQRAGLSRPAMGYHVTLLGPFLQRQPDAPIDTTQLGSIAAGTSALRLTVRGIGVFSHHASHTLYLHVHLTDALLTLKTRLWSTLQATIGYPNPDVREWNLPSNYHPHITLGIALTDQELAAFERTRSQSFEAELVAAEIAFLSQSGTEPWITKATFALGQSEPPSSPETLY